MPSNTNFIESWHTKIGALASRSHVSIDEILELFQDEAKNTTKKTKQRRAGKCSRKMNKEYQKARKQIKKVMKRRNKLKTMEFLKTIVDNMKKYY